MPAQRLILIVFAAIFTTFACGCGTGSTSTVSTSEEEGDLLGDLLGDLDLTEGRPAEVDESGQDTRTAGKLLTDSPADSLQLSSPPTAKAATEKLELRLSQGERFPLVKTIKQNLVQKSAEYPASAQTELQMHMVIEVNEVKSDAILLSVFYTRIAYQHDINGHRMAYDSDSHQGTVPQEIAPYAGMVNSGFAFWLGRDNQIQQLVGYQEFLQRCVQQVPVEQRGQMLANISARFGDDGVANFVDDTIGLLPFDRSVDRDSATRVAVGDVWTRERRLMQPVPVYMTSTCRLLALNERTAQINITGNIGDGQSYAEAGNDQAATVQITGGRSMGTCTIDRATGLPLQLERSVFVTMAVTTAAGQTVQQDKRIETTIQAFPAAQGPIVASPPTQQVPNTGQMPASAANQFAGRNLQRQSTLSTAPQPNYGNGVMQTSGQSAPQYGGRVSQIPTQPQPIDTSHLKSTATAVYPD